MIFPIFPSHELGLVFAVVSGFGFGFVLERAGFGRAQKLVGQFYGYDMSVFKVMFTAVVTAMLVIVVASGVGLTDFRLIADHATSATFVAPFIVGGMLVGMGFVMSGYCPGTSYVAMASGKIDGLVTVLGTIVGQVIWAEVEGRPGFARFHNSTALGSFYLWELLHLPDRVGPAIVAVAVVLMAVACFIGAEKLERLFAAKADPLAIAIPGGRPRRFVVAGLVSAALAGIVMLALPTGSRAGALEAAAISPADLARRVFDAPWSVRVLDVRPLADCAARRVPGSECIPVEDLPKLRLAEANAAREIVFVGAQDLAAVPPAAAGYPGKLAILQGGWKGWETYALTQPAAPAPGAALAELEDYRFRGGIQSALTGMKAAPPPPPPAASSGGGTKKAGGGGCSG